MFAFPLIRPFPLALAAFLLPIASSAADPDCAAAAKQVSRQVAAKPERVLIFVEDALVVNDSCACEIVKAALVSASASPKLAGQIVLIAINAAPTKATLIADCAKAASPDASADIDAALRKALGPDAGRPAAAPTAEPPPAASTKATDSGKQPVQDEKNPPSPPAPPAPDETDFGLSPVTIGGVYLVYPGSGSSPQVVKGKDGTLYYISPNGKRVPLEPPPPTKRPPRPPAVIIIRPPTPTTSDGTPEDPIPEDPIPIDLTPVDPAPIEPPL